MTEPTSKLIEFVRYYAQCPCCTEYEICVDECTFADDYPNGHYTMMQDREALKDAK